MSIVLAINFSIGTPVGETTLEILETGTSWQQVTGMLIGGFVVTTVLFIIFMKKSNDQDEKHED